MALFLLAAVPSASAAEVPAWREEIVTPHWDWEGQHLRGTVKALVMVNALAAREPDELAQRFDLLPTVVTVAGSYDNRICDNAAFAAALAANPDVVMLASEAAWLALSAENRAALWAKVNAGTPLLLYRQTQLDGPLAAWVRDLSGERAPPAPKRAKRQDVDLEGDEEDALATPAAPAAAFRTEPLPAELTAGLPVAQVPFRGGFRASLASVGRGRVLCTPCYDTHWTFFNAFVPEHKAFAAADDACVPDLSYAMSARLLRWLAAKDGPVRLLRMAGAEEPLALRTPLPLRVTLAAGVQTGDAWCWTLHAPFGEPLTSGRLELTAGQTELAAKLPLPRAGALCLRWRLVRGERAMDCGAVGVRTLGAVDVPRLSECRSPQLYAREPQRHDGTPAAAVRDSVKQGHWPVDNGPWTMDHGQWTVGRGRWAVANGPFGLSPKGATVGSHGCEPVESDTPHMTWTPKG